MGIISPQQTVLLHNVHFGGSFHSVADLGESEISRRSTVNNDFKA